MSRFTVPVMPSLPWSEFRFNKKVIGYLQGREASIVPVSIPCLTG